jgi:hypothetical protein
VVVVQVQFQVGQEMRVQMVPILFFLLLPQLVAEEVVGT